MDDQRFDDLTPFRIGATADHDVSNAWVRALASGVPLDEATESSFGVGFEDLNAQWRESLDADG